MDSEEKKGDRWLADDLKSAASVALIFFVASLAAAPVLTPDHRKLASEINTKTLKAAAAIKTFPKFSLRVKH